MWEACITALRQPEVTSQRKTNTPPPKKKQKSSSHFFGGREWGRVYFFNVLCAFYFDRDELLWPCNIQLNLNHMM